MHTPLTINTRDDWLQINADAGRVIHNPAAFFEERWRYQWPLGIFDEYLPGKCGFTDIDGIVEINGHILVLETKGAGCVPLGQKLTLSALQRRRVTSMVVWGKPMQPTKVRIYYPGGQVKEYPSVDLAWLTEKVRGWATWAQRHAPDEVIIKGE